MTTPWAAPAEVESTEIHARTGARRIRAIRVASASRLGAALGASSRGISGVLGLFWELITSDSGEVATGIVTHLIGGIVAYAALGAMTGALAAAAFNLGTRWFGPLELDVS